MFRVDDLLIGKLQNGDVRLVKLDPAFGRHQDARIDTIFAPLPDGEAWTPA